MNSVGHISLLASPQRRDQIQLGGKKEKDRKAKHLEDPPAEEKEQKALVAFSAESLVEAIGLPTGQTLSGSLLKLVLNEIPSSDEELAAVAATAVYSLNSRRK